MRFAFAASMLAVSLTATMSHAGPPKAGAPAAAASKNDLASNDPAKVQAALDDIRTGGTGSAAMAPLVAARLAQGLSPELAASAIDTLGDLEAEAGSTVLSTYAQHRNVKLRQAAIRALLKTKGAAAVKAFRRGLSDPDAMVRGLSASGLGAQKAKEALPDLMVALDHRVNEAAASIGMLCGPTECEALAGKLGKLSFDVVTSGLDQVLGRKDVSEDDKIKVIGKLRELGTAEANKYLRGIQARSQGASARMKQAIDQAIVATPGGAL